MSQLDFSAALGRAPWRLLAGLTASPIAIALALALALALAVMPTGSARAQSATWNLNGTGDYGTSGNWTPATVPTATAFFGVSNQNNVSLSGASIGGWTFNAGASAYTFTTSTNALTFTGAGIVINGGSATINNTNTFFSFIAFDNGSTAGSATITNNFNLSFNNSSTAGSALITNNFNLYFRDTSSAGTANITSNLNFSFNDSSSAGSAVITNNVGMAFNNSSTAGNANITNNGGLQFNDNSTGGSATITDGSGAGLNFRGNSTAGNAAIIGGNGEVDFSGSSGPLGNGQLSAGSIGGIGYFSLGANQLTVGSNNLSTTVSGVITDCIGGVGCDHPGATGGSLVKVGTGTLTLSGVNTYTGATTVDGGALEVDGSIATSSQTTVNNGAMLLGTGTVGNLQINSGGIFAPGATGAAGTSMTVAGNLAFASGAIYLVQLDPANATSAHVTAGGNAALNGTVDATFAIGSYVAKQYDILHAATLSGTFGSVNTLNLPAGFTASLSYSGTDVFLNLVAAIGGGPGNIGVGSIGTGGLNQNQQNVANALNTFFNNGGTLPPAFVNLFGLTGTNLQNALSQLGGENGTDAEKGAFQFMTEYLSLMLDPFVDGRGGSAGGGANGFAPEQTANFPPDVAQAYGAILKAPPKQNFEQRWTAWGSTFGGYNKTDGDPTVGSNTVTAHDFGFAGGMDYHVSPDTLVGFSLAGGGTNWGLVQGLGSGRSDAFSGGLYAKTRSGPWYLAGALAFADHWFTTDRTALGDQLNASFNGQSFGGRVETGYRFAGAPTVGITPYAALQAQSFHTPRYSETDVTGGGFGLTYNAMNATDTRSELGARFDDLTMLGAMPLILRARVAWAHDWISDPTLGAVFQALPGASFTVNGAAAPQNSALTSAGAELHMTANWSLAAKFDGEFAKGSQTYAGTGTLRYAW
jgi:autotransporter-associated beta strand protein